MCKLDLPLGGKMKNCVLIKSILVQVVIFYRLVIRVTDYTSKYSFGKLNFEPLKQGYINKYIFSA